jgi:pimeloyl-ACP methyl ester carboxylesterase
VLLHGNHTSGSPATSQYKVAEALAGKRPQGTMAVALIRPGYNDDAGNFSSGNAAGRGDNFTAANIDIVADAVARLKQFHKAAKVVLLGHSGGAAMAGVMLGRHPGLADAAVLVACPCNVPAWRAMSGRTRTPWTSESAIEYVARIPAPTRVAVIVGEKDEVTPPALSREYAEALERRGIAAELSVLEGIDHVVVIDSPEVVKAALQLGRGD